jgi:hypothetical protein
MQKMQLQHKRFIQLSMMQSLSEREWCVRTYPGSVPAATLINDCDRRPCYTHT